MKKILLALFLSIVALNASSAFALDNNFISFEAAQHQQAEKVPKTSNNSAFNVNWVL